MIDGQSPELLSKDQRFLEIVSAMMTVFGLIFLFLGLSCKVLDWAYCNLELFPVFGGDFRFPQDITMLNLPMALIVVGIGIRLRSPYGWWVITIILMALLTFFGFLVSFHWGNWPLEEITLGTWERVSMSVFPQSDAFLTCLISLMLILAGFFYWISPAIRDTYFQNRWVHPSPPPNSPTDT